MNVKTLAIDLAKRVFFLHGEDEAGHVALREKLVRARVMKRIAQPPPCTVVMEACGGAHYWARRFEEHGHIVRMINPKFVKPFVKSNKNDWNDAAAICEAAQRPTMRFVAPKSIYQQECFALNRIRQRLVMQRTAVALVATVGDATLFRNGRLPYGEEVQAGREGMARATKAQKRG